jgi:hypothetical protein
MGISIFSAEDEMREESGESMAHGVFLRAEATSELNIRNVAAPRLGTSYC